MSKAAPSQLTLSGTVHHSRPLWASIGDVCIHPGANRTHYIDGYVYDGQQWRKLHLRSFGQVARLFDEPGDIGAVMRGIEAVLVRNRGVAIYYERTGKGSSYVFRGVPFPTHFR
jgi:hypothetical protein